MHHYADTVTEGRGTLKQTESRRKNSEHIISDKGVISSANFVITVIWNIILHIKCLFSFSYAEKKQCLKIIDNLSFQRDKLNYRTIKNTIK